MRQAKFGACHALTQIQDRRRIPRLRDPALLNAFAALADPLKMVLGQISSDTFVTRIGDGYRHV